MKELETVDKIFNELVSIQESLGIWAAIVAFIAILIMVVGGLFFYHLIIKKAESVFKRSLSDYQGEIVTNIGTKFLNQKENIDTRINNLRGEIEKGLIKQEGEIKENITRFKGEMDKELSKVQSDLSLITGQRMTFLNQEREALIDYYAAITNWISMLIDSPIKKLNLTNLPILDIYLKRLEAALLDHNVKTAKVDLFLANEDLEKLKIRLSSTVFSMHSKRVEMIIDIKTLMEEYMNKKIAGELVLKDELSKLSENCENIEKAFITKFTVDMDKIIPQNKVLKNKIHLHIKSSFSEE